MVLFVVLQDNIHIMFITRGGENNNFGYSFDENFSSKKNKTKYT